MTSPDDAGCWMELVRPSVLSPRLVLRTNFGLEQDFQLTYRARHTEALPAVGGGPRLRTDGGRLIQQGDLRGDVKRALLTPSGVSWAGTPLLTFEVEKSSAVDHWSVRIGHVPSGEAGVIRCDAACGINLHTRCRLAWPTVPAAPTVVLAALMYWWTRLENDRISD